MGTNEICVIKSSGEIYQIVITRMKNAAMMVWTSVVVSSLLIFTNTQIRLFEYAN